MRDGLYHQKLGFPAGAAQQFVGSFHVQLSPHALQAARDDRYGKIDIRDGDPIEVAVTDVIEIECRRQQPVKAVVRLAYDGERDIVLAIIREDIQRRVRVKTCWLNLASDKHQTLNRTRYIKP